MSHCKIDREQYRTVPARHRLAAHHHVIPQTKHFEHDANSDNSALHKRLGRRSCSPMLFIRIAKL